MYAEGRGYVDKNMEEGHPSKTYVSTFRVGDSHFTVDLQNPLGLYTADVILCLDPNPDFSQPIYSGLTGTEERDGPLRRIEGGHCALIYTVEPEIEMDTQMIIYWFSQLADYGFRRVIVTEPKSLIKLDQPQLFISMLLEAGTGFLKNTPKSEVIYTTYRNDLYEHAFGMLVRQKNLTFDEGNSGIIDDEDLLRRLYASLQCFRCGKMHPKLYFSDCCKVLQCQNCQKYFAAACPKCRNACNFMEAILCSKVLQDTQVTCRCGTSMLWKNFDQHAFNCDAITVTCSQCRQAFSRLQLLPHIMKSHEMWLLENYASPIGVKELTALQRMQERVVVQEVQEVPRWECDCGNVNAMQGRCVKCGAPQPRS